MKKLQTMANSSSDPDRKKEAQEYYKEISKLTEDYFNLIKKTIPETEDKIQDIKNETISAQKEIADILKKQKDDYIKKEEEKTEKVKDEISKRKELMNKQWETEDKQDELAEKQKKLAQLEADLTNALRTGDESLAYNIRQQIAEAQKDINDFINQSERDIANDKFDEEMDKLDEDLEKKIDMIEEKFSDENLLSMVQAGVTDLSSALKNIDVSTNGVNRSFAFVVDSVNNIGQTIGTTWLTNMDKMIDKVKELGLAFPSDISVGVNSKGVTNKSKSTGSSSIKIDMGGINLNGITREEFDREFDKAKEEIYKTIDSNLNR